MQKKRHLQIQSIALIAILLAAEVVLSRFLSISLPALKIGFAFIPIAIAARKLGGVEAALVAGLGDLLGAMLFPSGPYFPGFTLTTVLRAFASAAFYHKKVSLLRVSGAVLVGELFGSVLLNTLWISILYGTPYLVLLPTRLVSAAVMTVVQTSLLWLLFSKGGKVLDPEKA